MARILIMEDNVDQAYQLTGMLNEAGHEAVWRGTGSEAREALAAERFDILIADLYVHKGGRSHPDGGIGLIGWVRNGALTPERAWMADMPIIAITGAVNLVGNEYALEVARSLGANDTLAKPFAPYELVEAVQLQLANRGAQGMASDAS